MTEITVIGLGAMGTPIARNLLAAGHAVTVWNRTPGRAGSLVDAGATEATSLAEAFRSEIVFSILSNDAAVESALLDEELVASIPSGTVHVNLATVSPDLARRAADVHARAGIDYISAPVFGRVAVAEAGELNVLAAGDAAVIERVRPLLEVIGAKVWVLGGDPAQANIVKILGNYLVACAIESLGEVLSIGRRVDLDPHQLVELYTSTLFPGGVYSSYGKTIADERFTPAGFTAELGRKDVRLANTVAVDNDLTLPFGQVLDARLTEVISGGRGDADWAIVGVLDPDDDGNLERDRA